MKLISHIKLMFILRVDILVEVRLGMRLFLEFAIMVLLEVSIQETNVPAVQLYSFVHVSNSCIVEVYRQSIQCFGVIVYSTTISKCIVIVVTKFLKSSKSVEGPNFIVISCVFKGSWNFFDKNLPAS